MSAGQKESPGLTAAGLREGINETLEVHAQSNTHPLPRQAAVIIMLEPGCKALIVPICDNDTQEAALTPLLERAKEMVRHDPEQHRFEPGGPG
jgi:hypothetical protein